MIHNLVILVQKQKDVFCEGKKAMLVAILVAIKLADSLLLLLPTAQRECISTVIIQCWIVGADCIHTGRSQDIVSK